MRRGIPALASAYTAGLALLGGCAAGPLPGDTLASLQAHPPSQDTTALSEPGGEAWWRRLQAPALDAIVEQGLRDSPLILRDQRHVQEAQSYYAAQAGRTRYPAVDLRGASQRERTNLAGLGLSALPAPGPYALHSVRLQVDYRFDLFGASTQLAESMRHEANALQARLLAGRQALAANLVGTAVKEASLRQQIESGEARLAREQTILAMVERQAARGGATNRAVLAQRNAVGLLAVGLESQRKALAQTRHRLAASLGRDPDAPLPIFHLDDFQQPDPLPASVPSDLLRRRPDVLEAQERLYKAAALARVAQADLYPSLTLSAMIGADALSLSSLFGPGSAVWNLGGAVLAPLFRGGELSARRDAAFAAHEAAVHNYAAVVQAALRDVADVLKAIEHDNAVLHAKASQLARQEALHAMTVGQWRRGNETRVTLLEAETALDEARKEHGDARADLLADTAALYMALGK